MLPQTICSKSLINVSRPSFRLFYTDFTLLCPRRASPLQVRRFEASFSSYFSSPAPTTISRDSIHPGGFTWRAATATGRFLACKSLILHLLAALSPPLLSESGCCSHCTFCKIGDALCCRDSLHCAPLPLCSYPPITGIFLHCIFLSVPGKLALALMLQ